MFLNHFITFLWSGPEGPHFARSVGTLEQGVICEWVQISLDENFLIIHTYCVTQIVSSILINQAGIVQP